MGMLEFENVLPIPAHDVRNVGTAWAHGCPSHPLPALNLTEVALWCKAIKDIGRRCVWRRMGAAKPNIDGGRGLVKSLFIMCANGDGKGGDGVAGGFKFRILTMWVTLTVDGSLNICICTIHTKPTTRRKPLTWLRVRWKTGREKTQHFKTKKWY